MITAQYLEKMSFVPSDIEIIIEHNEKYKDRIEPLIKEYMATMNKEFFSPYEIGEREQCYEKALAFSKGVQEKIPEVSEYMARLLAWLNCTPLLYEEFQKNGIGDELFFATTGDIANKVKECKALYGECGISTDWFFMTFDLRLFTLGRLQYELKRFEYDKYTASGVTIKKNDIVYSCHIPSDGKLTAEACMDSFQCAYEFFRPSLSGNILPVICSTWLFYKPYIEHVYEKDSNLARFSNLFDIIESASYGYEFKDAWRVFNKKYEGSTKDLPTDNSLRRNFVRYIENGGDFGYGYGILLYDGEKREIIK